MTLRSLAHILIVIVLCLLGTVGAGAAKPKRVKAVVKPPIERFEVEGGVLHAIVDSVQQTDSLATALGVDRATLDSMSHRQIRKLELARRDSLEGRYTRLFRDTMPISRMTAISMVAPGFSQLHNRQAWKIPLLYGSVGTAVYFGLQQNKCYQKAKSHYNDLVYQGATRENSDLDRTQQVMIKYNTRRQLLFGAAAAAYIYFLGDGLMNHPGSHTNVKIATTLSTVCPGAGQIYNKSYWKAPIVMGAFATMAMMVDWNNRGYERFKTAYNLKQAERNDAVEPGLQSRSADEMLSYRKAYRRNRDLCIILTGAVYLLNIIDAHVDAHMQNFDVSTDLRLAFTPTFTQFSTPKGQNGALGMSMSFKF